MWELAARCSKASAREARLVERKVCFILEACSWREGGLLLKGKLPTDSGKSFKGGLSGCVGQGRATRRTAHSALTVILWLVIRWWSDQHHLGCFTYSQSSVPGPFVFHFFESSSWDCGSLCRGCSRVIMQLASST